MKIKSGKIEERKIVITGTSEEFDRLADALDIKLSWTEVEEEFEIEDGFFSELNDALRDGDV